ncbi:uncharacterized protein BX664DRAFT_339776 [Halteromyces radiatus]|uniref:uncharacterized protein n=1 Tax=Halteromyces radiatus TaxID=101107 RepID=UPI00221F6800|nr:uncharacterized protein BX664DRAFT_339776 [Halteromyces radiatus]KAI8083082.1 hypothetical protein BX664DRAFT_339776 [Halteromyces radiatus]
MENRSQDIPRQGERWTSIQSRRDNAGEATRMFVSHVRHYFSSLPLLSILAIAIPILTNVLDILTLIAPTHDMYFYQWCHLSITSIYRYQVQRLLLYPLVHPGTSILITNLILLVPYISVHERRKGSLCLLYELVVIFTLLPAVLYLFIVSLGISLTDIADDRLGVATTSGLSVWVIALSFWSMLDEQSRGEVTNHSLFGVVPLPSKTIPFLLVVFYFFLMPDSSLILHLCVAGIVYLYSYRQLPSNLRPTNEMYRQYENQSWLRLLTTHPKYINVESASSGNGYLPVTTSDARGSSSSAFRVNTSSISSPPPPASNPRSNFPGHGYTLTDD